MSKRVFIAFLFILALGAFFRFYLITEFPLGLYPDEAMNGNNALEALETGNFKIFYPENNGREGLFINIQAISVWFFGNEAWALRLISAIFGTLTILGVFLLTKELFTAQNPKSEALNPKQIQNSNVSNSKPFRISNLEFRVYHAEIIALLSSFFLAVSYWHINFSRIGFRAITVPMLATFGLYFLLKGLRRGKILDLVWAGIFIGLGFHTYIAFRFMPFVLAVPLAWYLWKRWKERQMIGSRTSYHFYCTPCAILLFIFITFVVALPIGYYFLQNPGDFLGRSGQVSIFSAESPLIEFAKSNIATMGMFFVHGDCNFRHNYACQPELHPIVAFFFLIGLLTALVAVVQKLKIKNSPGQSQDTKILHFAFCILLLWLTFMSLPATLTREGLPHALRSIGMIPPVMILAGLGAERMLNFILQWFEKQKEKWPTRIMQLGRIQIEITILFIGALLFIPLATYATYFIRWAQNPDTYFAFSTDLRHLGEYLNTLSPEIKKYVIVNLDGVEVRGLPMPAQTVIFLTNTFTEKERNKKNIEYLTANDLQDKLKVVNGQKTVITFLKGSDRPLLQAVKKIAPNFKGWAPSDFVLLQNY